MERSIGMDVHASSTTIGIVITSGKRIASEVVATNGAALVEALTRRGGIKRLCLEECPQSGWLTEILTPHVAEVVVVGVGERRSRGPKSDAKDAFALANRLRLHDYSTPVFKPVAVYAQLRELTKAHRQVVGDVTRVQSRIKAMLRARGVPAVGPRVYSTQGRVAAIEALPSHGRGAVELLYAAYDALVPIRHAAQRAVVQELHRHAISRVLETCPGFGPIRVAELIATMVTPKRFRTRQQFWLRLWWKAV